MSRRTKPRTPIVWVDRPGCDERGQRRVGILMKGVGHPQSVKASTRPVIRAVTHLPHMLRVAVSLQDHEDVHERQSANKRTRKLPGNFLYPWRFPIASYERDEEDPLISNQDLARELYVEETVKLLYLPNFRNGSFFLPLPPRLPPRPPRPPRAPPRFED